MVEIHSKARIRLLTEEDPDLFAWFMGHEECKDEQLNGMVSLILDRVRV